MVVAARRARRGGSIVERLDNIVDVSKETEPLTALRSILGGNCKFNMAALVCFLESFHGDWRWSVLWSRKCLLEA